MNPFALELDDRCFAIARGGRVLSLAPSAVFDGSGSEPAGADAWHALRRHPTGTSTQHASAVLGGSASAARATALFAAEVARRLASTPADGERAWIAVPARVDARGLGTVLDITRGLGLSVDGFVDAAAASVAALAPDRNAIVVEVGLHHLAATAVDSEGQARRRRSVLGARGGLIELYDAWLDLISTAMVKRTRFDPLHNAETEQQIFDAMPALTSEASASGGATAVVTVGTQRFEVALSRDQFAESAQPIYKDMLRMLHSLRSAGAPVALILPRPIADLPGLRDSLAQFVRFPLISVRGGGASGG